VHDRSVKQYAQGVWQHRRSEKVTVRQPAAVRAETGEQEVAAVSVAMVADDAAYAGREYIQNVAPSFTTK